MEILYAAENKMTIGTIINVDTSLYIHGGVPFIDENGKRYYKCLSAEGLYPDFQISKKGIITGQAVQESPARVGSITVIDSRGTEATISVHIAKIVKEGA